jgi:hypothetical protein
MFFRSEADVVRAFEVFGETRAGLDAWEQAGPMENTFFVRLSGRVSPAHWTAIVIPRWFSPAHGWLLWIRQTGVFPSSELPHLYYTLRFSYGVREDLRTLPGHEFLSYEMADLRSFLFLAVSFGWDAHLLTYGGPGRAFFSHDGWFRFSLDANLLPPAVADLDQVGAEYA